MMQLHDELFSLCFKRIARKVLKERRRKDPYCVRAFSHGAAQELAAELLAYPERHVETATERAYLRLLLALREFERSRDDDEYRSDEEFEAECLRRIEMLRQACLAAIDEDDCLYAHIFLVLLLDASPDEIFCKLVDIKNTLVFDFFDDDFEGYPSDMQVEDSPTLRELSCPVEVLSNKNLYLAPQMTLINCLAHYAFKSAHYRAALTFCNQLMSAELEFYGPLQEEDSIAGASNARTEQTGTSITEGGTAGANELHDSTSQEDVGDALAAFMQHLEDEFAGDSALPQDKSGSKTSGQAQESSKIYNQTDELAPIPQDKQGIFGIFCLCLARLESETNFNVFYKALPPSERKKPALLLAHTLLLYKLGRLKAASRALTSFCDYAPCAAYALLRPVYVGRYLPNREDARPGSFEELAHVVGDADPLIVDSPYFIDWVKAQPGIEARAKSFAEDEGFDW